MGPDDAVDAYSEWLFRILKKGDLTERYRNLLLFLSCKEFVWLMRHDEDRAVDGLALRDAFAVECGYDHDFWRPWLSEKCSLLEMLTALAIRCEAVLCDPEEGDRTADWFWMMLDNIGLLGMYNEHFDMRYCDFLADRLMKRKYDPNGTGGLFVTDNPDVDMRRAEFWYQMNVWLEENFG